MTDTKRSLWDEIKHATDELEVKIQEAGVEAKNRWQALKPRLKELEQKMEVKTTEASAWVAEEMGNVGTLVKELRDDVVKKIKK